MNECPDSDLQAELAALRQRLGCLEAEHRALIHRASRGLYRRGLSRGLMLGVFPLVALLALSGGLLYAQGDAVKAAVDALFIDQNGNVGIGTGLGELKAKLDVNGDMHTSDKLVIGNSSNQAIYLNPHGAGVAIGAQGINEQGKKIPLYLNYGDNPTLINFDKGGVGIGTNFLDEKNKLSVKGNTLITGNLSTTGDVEIGAHLKVKNGSVFEGKRHMFTDEEQKTKLRVGAAWGIPGIYSEEGDLVLGVPPNKEVKIGTHGSFMTVSGKTGNVGIGTTNPTKGKLEVSGVGVAQSISYKYITGRMAFEKDQNPGEVHGNQSASYSIWADDRIATTELNLTSDGRTKNVIGLSDSRQDLETLNKLQVTDYTLIDEVKNGVRPQKKLVGQQVQKVYPQAVNVTEDFIPNVYSISISTVYDEKQKRLTISIPKPHGLVAGDTVRLIDAQGDQEVEVLKVDNAQTFTVTSDRGSKNVFVYGKRVDDFLLLDYGAIAMLNLSATQELAKRLATQQSRLTIAQQTVQHQLAELAAVEAHVVQLEAAVQRVTTTRAFVVSDAAALPSATQAK